MFPAEPQVLIANAEPTLELARKLDNEAGREGPVLITGEAGSGRTFVAWLLHQRRHGDHAPFFTLDLSQASPALHTELLLGKHALLETGGTICLKEIEHLHDETQALLARRPGGLKAQVIGTTTRPPDSIASQAAPTHPVLGLFESRFAVPPLRERLQDLPDLVGQILSKLAHGGARSRTPRPELLAALQRYEWPGNVRELEAVLQAALARSNSDPELGVAALGELGQVVGSAAFDPGQSYRETRSRFETNFEKEFVSWLLGRHQENISAAAREARMDRKHLYDLARKHGFRRARATDD